jgi:hypothetical protein
MSDDKLLHSRDTYPTETAFLLRCPEVGLTS